MKFDYMGRYASPWETSPRGAGPADGRGVFHEIGLIGMLLGEISGPSALVKAVTCGEGETDPGAIRNNRKTQKNSVNSVWFYCSRRIPHDGRLRRRLLQAGMVRPSVFSGSPSMDGQPRTRFPRNPERGILPMALASWLGSAANARSPDLG
ncbi:hypothetical protein N7475_000247 [Penicillium sp. IBT 31633x]|nr:hypothetical protein N7475_000247 [Penicillium sp. IBT 31633x]